MLIELQKHRSSTIKYLLWKIIDERSQKVLEVLRLK